MTKDIKNNPFLATLTLTTLLGVGACGSSKNQSSDPFNGKAFQFVSAECVVDGKTLPTVQDKSGYEEIISFNDGKVKSMRKSEGEKELKEDSGSYSISGNKIEVESIVYTFEIAGDKIVLERDVSEQKSLRECGVANASFRSTFKEIK